MASAASPASSSRPSSRWRSRARRPPAWPTRWRTRRGRSSSATRASPATCWRAPWPPAWPRPAARGPAVAAGVAAAGGEALLGGVLPTPGAPLLIRRHGLDLGVVLSASHNPYEDNGIKFFGGDGFKLTDETEHEIERILEAAHVEAGEPGTGAEDPAAPGHPTPRIGRVTRFHGALEDYLRALHERFEALELSGRRIALDCANGATYRAAPEIFRRLGAELEVVAAEPDGRNINAGCGSTHIETLADHVRTHDLDAGFAFDGDGDRALAVDRRG